jgi:hypothetical protein
MYSKNLPDLLKVVFTAKFISEIQNEEEKNPKNPPSPSRYLFLLLHQYYSRGSDPESDGSLSSPP